MRQIPLREYEPSKPVPLSGEEIRGLRAFAPHIRLEPSRNQPAFYELTPESHVGLLRIGDLQVEIRPKMPIDRFFFILSYAVDPTLWRREQVVFARDDTLLDAIAPAYCRLVADATHCGLLHGYRVHEDAMPMLRGQVRFCDQLRRRYTLPLPVEVRYDEFTEDIVENRILLAAIEILRDLPLRSAQVRRGLHEIAGAFHAVSFVRFPPDKIPSVHFTRLNQHYAAAIQLATLILRSASFELGGNAVTGTGFLVDMNGIFEAFVHRALREVLQLSDKEFPLGDDKLRLDAAGSIKLKPDLSWWRKGRCVFVGDVKYKEVNEAGVLHPDLYQLLAYTIAADLPAGLLVYAAGKGNPVRHRICHAGKTLVVESVKLSCRPEQILDKIADISREIVSLHLHQG